MKLKIYFLLIFLFPICVCSPFAWDSTATENNVHTFGKFVDHIFLSYRKEYRKIEPVLQYAPLYEEENYKRTIFNYTFVKWAAELAHFRVINKNNSQKAYQNWNVVPKEWSKNIFLGFLFYDQTLGHTIANAFESEFFSNEKTISKILMDQIMQLTFSFAVRVILCVVHVEYFIPHDNVGGWQLKTLLEAYKKISNNNSENGIFPFQIVKIVDDEKKSHQWAELFIPDNDGLKPNEKEQQRYIENFKFIIELSNCKMHYYEINNMYNRIKKKNPNEQEPTSEPSKIYNILTKHFKELLPPKKTSFFNNVLKNGKKTSKDCQKNSELSMDCVLFSFVKELQKQMPFYYDGNDNAKFNCPTHKKSETSARIKYYPNYEYPKNFFQGTPAENSKRIEMELFKEPLWNYAYVIGIEGDEFLRWGTSVVLDFCNDIKEMVESALKDTKKNEHLIKNLTKSKEYQLLYISLQELKFSDVISKLNSFEKQFVDEKKIAGKAKLLKELLSLLFEEIKKEYVPKMNEYRKNETHILKTFEEKLKNENEIRKFCQILHNALKMMKKNPDKEVKYDEMQQLLTIPLSMAERFIEQLYDFNYNKNEPYKFERHQSRTSYAEIDFVKAIQSVALGDGKYEKNRNAISPLHNLQFFQWLFSLAIRLCTQMNGNDDNAGKYLSQFVSAYKESHDILNYGEFFEYTIKIGNEIVEINLPNWNLPYSVYLKNEKELIDSEIKEKFKVASSFLFYLPEYSPTLIEVIKMAKILYEKLDDGQVSIPEIFRFTLTFLPQESCILENFVIGLWKKANAQKELPQSGIIQSFDAQMKPKCTEKSLKEETLNYFGVKKLDISALVQINYEFGIERQQLEKEILMSKG